MTDVLDAIAEKLFAKYGADAALAAAEQRDYGDLTVYQEDPVRFGEEILGEDYTEDVKEMLESVRDNVITIAKSANATGKTHGAARACVWWQLCFPDAQVWSTAAPPEDNLRKLLWGEIGHIREKNPSLFENFVKLNDLHYEVHKKSFLTGAAIPMSGTEAQREAKFSGKHAPYLLFVVDEGDAVPEEVYRGIESCMSGGTVRLLVMFNPRHASGRVYQMERDGLARVVRLSAFSHPNVVTGENVIPGAVDRPTTIRRINQWCRPLVSDEEIDGECFELPGFLAGEVGESQAGVKFPPLKAGYYKIMDPAFSYMVLGEYPSQNINQLISKAWVDKARERWDIYVRHYGELVPNLSGVMGLDPAEYGQDANASLVRYGGFVTRPKVWGGVDILSSADKGVIEYNTNYNVICCNVDANGVGAGVAPQMQRNGCSSWAVKTQERATEKTEMGEFRLLRDQLWWNVREWLRFDPGAMLPPDEELMEELLVPTYEIKKGKIIVMPKDTMRELLKRSPNKADALCLTFAPTKKMSVGMTEAEADDLLAKYGPPRTIH